MIYSKKQIENFQNQIKQADHIVIMQAESIDADSLGSSLGLESALVDQGKKVTMFAYDAVPSYLHHLPGWDRVTDDLPNDYDLAILVDSSVISQMERTWAEHKGAIANRPLVCIDHHVSGNGKLEGENITFLTDETAAASAQQVVELAWEFDWHIDEEAAYALASAIKADSVNLSTHKTTSRTFAAMGYLVDRGADLEKLRYNIEQTSSMWPKDVPLKAAALGRTQFFKNNQVAITYFTREEVESLGDDKLVVEQMKQGLRMLKGVAISVIITERGDYSNASMRADIDIASKVAEHFGGGGHDRAASCRFTDATHEDVIEQIVPVISGYIDEQYAKTL